MAVDLVSPEDYAALLNLMGAYQHLVDDGDEQGWAELFTPDGAFIGLPGEDFIGHEALKRIPQISLAQFGGKFRHNLCCFAARYGATRDEAFARYYMIGTVTPKGAATSVAMQVDVSTHLVRVDGEWKIKSNRMAML